MFNDSFLSSCPKRIKSVKELLSWFYLKGVSTGVYGKVLRCLFGEGRNYPSIPHITGTADKGEKELAAKENCYRESSCG